MGYTLFTRTAILGFIKGLTEFLPASFDFNRARMAQCIGVVCASD